MHKRLLHVLLFIRFHVGCHSAKVSRASVAAFEEFILAYGRNYSKGAEYDTRNAIFQASLAAVEAQNAKPNKIWTAAINHLSDRSLEEIKALNGWRGGVSKSKSITPAALISVGATGIPSWLSSAGRSVSKRLKALATGEATSGIDLPEEKSYMHLWTAQPAQIHNQNCGNCWAAATASLLEAHAEIHTGEQRHFSFHELTHCTENPFNCGGTGGCQGATSELALHQVMVNGIGREEGVEQKCAGKKPIVDRKEQGRHEWGPGVRLAEPDHEGRKIGMVGWERLPENNYEAVMRALVERGPVAVAVAPEWANYGSGIFDGCQPDATITHSVLAMGYGKDVNLQDTKYWLIQNSWGTGFGENGLIRIKRQEKEGEYCGTDTQPTLGTACDKGPSEVKVCGMCGILYDVTVPYFERVKKF